jgi:hypothetical protein
MVADVRKHLKGRGVPDERIIREVYFVAPDRLNSATGPQVKTVTPPPPPPGAIKKAS